MHNSTTEHLVPDLLLVKWFLLSNLFHTKLKFQQNTQDNLACRNPTAEVTLHDGGREMFFWVNHLFHTLHQDTLGQSPSPSLNIMEM